MIEFAGDAGARQGRVDGKRQAFTREVVDYDEDTKAPPIPDLIGDEVEASALVGPVRQVHWCACPDGALAPADVSPRFSSTDG